MIELIQNLCQRNDFVLSNIEVSELGYPLLLASPKKGSENQEYFIIAEPKDVDDEFLVELESKQSEIIMEHIELEQKSNGALKKNSTFILCCKEGNISKRELLKFEESPFHFKKNAIQYSEDEVIALQEALNQDYSNININRLLAANSGQSFENFKTNSESLEEYYPLLMGIVTKLPFIHYSPSSNQLESIETFVENSLEQEQLVLLDLICNGSLDKNSMDELIKKEFLNDK